MRTTAAIVRYCFGTSGLCTIAGQRPMDTRVKTSACGALVSGPPACSLCFARCTLTNQYTAPKEAIRLRKRRYALPANEAEIVRLALRITLDGLEETKNDSAYMKWVHARAEELLNKLQNYQWEVF
jgi:hypothetical protein